MEPDKLSTNKQPCLLGKALSPCVTNVLKELFSAENGVFSLGNHTLIIRNWFNGFSISAGLSEQLPEEIKKRYFGAGERGLLFIAFLSEITNYILDDLSVTEDDFLDIFGLPKTAYFA